MDLKRHRLLSTFYSGGVRHPVHTLLSDLPEAIAKKAIDQNIVEEVPADEYDALFDLSMLEGDVDAIAAAVEDITDPAHTSRLLVAEVDGAARPAVVGMALAATASAVVGSLDDDARAAAAGLLFSPTDAMAAERDAARAEVSAAHEQIDALKEELVTAKAEITSAAEFEVDSILGGNVEDVEAAVDGIEEPAHLATLLAAEVVGKNRKGVVEAVTAKMRALAAD